MIRWSAIDFSFFLLLNEGLKTGADACFVDANAACVEAMIREIVESARRSKSACVFGGNEAGRRSSIAFRNNAGTISFRSRIS
jgi:hypothetical protein